MDGADGAPDKHTLVSSWHAMQSLARSSAGGTSLTIADPPLAVCPLRAISQSGKSLESSENETTTEAFYAQTKRWILLNDLLVTRR